MALISAKLDRLRQSRPHEYAIRFVFGGLCTAGAGLVAKHYGPEIGGLFLAFPAIFPAGATLIAAHEQKRKAREGLNGRARGVQAAALDASGAALGGIGLIAYALLLRQELPAHRAFLMIALATVLWAAVSGVLWLGWKRRPLRGMHRRMAQRKQEQRKHAHPAAKHTSHRQPTKPTSR